MTLEIHQFPCLSDNYGFLLHDPDSVKRQLSTHLTAPNILPKLR